MVWCGVVWRGVAWRGVAWRGVLVLWCCVVLCCVVLCCGVVWCGVVCGEGGGREGCLAFPIRCIHGARLVRHVCAASLSEPPPLLPCASRLHPNRGGVSPALHLCAGLQKKHRHQCSRQALFRWCPANCVGSPADVQHRCVDVVISQAFLAAIGAQAELEHSANASSELRWLIKMKPDVVC